SSLQAAGERTQPDERHLPDGLEHDRAAHLRVALLAVDECDRDLDDAEAGAQDAVRRLDLERVAPRIDRAEVDRLEHASPKALEPAGQVADGALQDGLGIEIAAERDGAADEAPVRDRAAVGVARPEDQVGASL